MIYFRRITKVAVNAIQAMQEDEEEERSSAGTLQAAFEAFHKHDVDEDHLISSKELLAVLQEAGLKVGTVCSY